jgi:hypothetical protein
MTTPAQLPEPSPIRVANFARYDGPDAHARVFIDDYATSRAAFLDDAAQLDRALRDAGHPGLSLDEAPIAHPRGGVTRAIDSLHAPAAHARDKALILTTGVHGLEGPVGAAKARALLGGLLGRINFANTSLTIVHAVNPHGWAESRRENLDGDDLNRSESIARLKQSALLADGNAALRKVAREIELPGRASTLLYAALQTLFRLGRGLLFGEYTRKDIVNAIGYGQSIDKTSFGYADPKHRPPEIVALNRVLAPVVETHDRVVHIDAHSGVTGAVTWRERLLGRARYTAGLWTSTRQSPDDEALTRALLDKPGPLLTAIGDAAQTYIDEGDIPEKVQTMARKPGARVVALTFEQATMRLDARGLVARLLAYQGLRNGWRSERDRLRAEAVLRDVFVPRDARWRRSAFRNFLALHELLAPFFRDDCAL